MFNITSGNIRLDVLYLVFGAKSVIYKGITYASGETFRGVASLSTFFFSGTGSELVYEVSEFRGGSIIFDENSLDSNSFADIIKVNGFSVEYQQIRNDIIFNDITIINGFSLELLDFPFYSFMISETRL